MDKPILAGEIVTLRPVRAEDAEASWQLATDAEARRLSGVTTAVSREEVADWCATVSRLEHRYDWAVTALGRDEMLGEVVLSDIDESVRSARVRIGVRTGHRGRGYARESMMLVLRFAFAPPPEGLGLHRVGLEVLSINPRAFALYDSLGFVTEGRRRDDHLDGSWHCDTIIMGMLEDEYAHASSAWQ